MTDFGPLPLTATTGNEFRARGEENQLTTWLAEARPDLSQENRRQLCHHVRKVLDLLGRSVPATIATDPDTVERWIVNLDLTAAGLDPRRRSHLTRAARTLYAAVNDLPADAARAAMDRKRRGSTRRPSIHRVRPAAACKNGTAIPAAQPGGGPGAIAVYRERPDGTIVPFADRNPPEADMPRAYRFLETAIANHVSLALEVGSARPDIVATARAVLAIHSPAVRMGIVSRLPGIESVRVAAPTDLRPSPLEVCDAIILTFVEARGVVLRDEPVAAA